MNPGQLSPGNTEPPILSSGGHQDLLVPELLARAQDDRVRGRIDGRDARSAAKVYTVFGVPASRPDIPAFEVLLRPQVSLGQRRTTKRDARFLADDHDRSGETLLPQGRGGIASRHAAAHDHDRVPADCLSHGVHSAIAAHYGA